MFQSVYAHGQVHHQASIWLNWSLPFHIILVLIIVLGLYFRGVILFNEKMSTQFPKWRIICYLIGWLLLLLALISPIDVYADSLAWVHMLQHTIILMISAPLMVLGRPAYIGHWSLSKNILHNNSILRVFYVKTLGFSKAHKPILAWLLYSLTLWIWHIPLFYESALANETIHDIQHIAFFITSYFFWKVLFDPFKERFMTIIGIIYPFIASLHSIILGVLMTLSPKAWYDPYILTAPNFNLTPLEDQQIAGFIMWMPAGVTYAAAAISIVILIFKI